MPPKGLTKSNNIATLKALITLPKNALQQHKNIPQITGENH